MLPRQSARLNPAKNTPRRSAFLPAYKELGLSKNRETIGMFINSNEEFKTSKAIRPLVIQDFVAFVTIAQNASRQSRSKNTDKIL